MDKYNVTKYRYKVIASYPTYRTKVHIQCTVPDTVSKVGGKLSLTDAKMVTAGPNLGIWTRRVKTIQVHIQCRTY